MVGSRAVAIALFATFAAWPASASLLEQSTGGLVAYQFDADSHHDAPDACKGAAAAWSLPLGATTDGMLLPPDDLSDVFVLDVPFNAVGDRVTLRLTEAAGAGDLQMLAFLPGCLSDVFAPESQPKAPPAPPAPAAGEAQVEAGTASKGACAHDWFFLVQGLAGAAAPASLHAAWTDGSEATVPLTHATPSVAMYRTAAGTGFTLTGAWINLPVGFTGSFEVAHAPCGTVDGGAVYGEVAQAGDDRIAFTPIRAGPHAIQVRPAPPAPPPVGTSVPMSCHMCISGLDQLAEKASYLLSSSSMQPSA